VDALGLTVSGFDWTVSLGNVITMSGVLVAAMWQWFDLRNRSVDNRARADRAQATADQALKEASSAEEAVRKASGAEIQAAALRQEVRILFEQFTEFKVQVAQTYLTAALHREFRQEIHAGFEKLGDRIDRLIQRERGDRG